MEEGVIARYQSILRFLNPKILNEVRDTKDSRKRLTIATSRTSAALFEGLPLLDSCSPCRLPVAASWSAWSVGGCDSGSNTCPRTRTCQNEANGGCAGDAAETLQATHADCACTREYSVM